jgi:hypothetical protein
MVVKNHLHSSSGVHTGRVGHIFAEVGGEKTLLIVFKENYNVVSQWELLYWQGLGGKVCKWLKTFTKIMFSPVAPLIRFSYSCSYPI